MHVRGRRLGDPGAELDGRTAELFLEDRGEALADVGVVAVAGQVDQNRDVAAVRVAADEHPQLPPLPGVHDRLGDRGQLVDGRVEELVARVGLEGVHQRLAGVAARVEPDPAQHLGGLLPKQRDPGERLGVRSAREQAEEPALADHLAVLVELLHADVVEERRAMDGGPRVGLGQDQQGLLPRLLLDQGGQLPERGRHVLVGTQDAEAGAGDRAQQLVVVVALEAVLAVAEEREVVGRQPTQQLAALRDLLLAQREPVGLQLVDDGQHLGVHLLPVLDRLPDVAQHLEQRVLDGAGVLVVGDPGDLDVHPGLADRVRGRHDRAVRDRGDRLEGAGDVADHVELRVDDRVHVTQLAGQRHGQRVHEERHVVGDHLDDGVTAGGPAGLADGRGEHPHLGGALRAGAGGLVVRREGAVQVDVRAVADVLGGDVPVVRLQQAPDGVLGRSPTPPPSQGQIDRLGQEFGLFTVERRGHNSTLGPAGEAHNTRHTRGP